MSRDGRQTRLGTRSGEGSALEAAEELYISPHLDDVALSCGGAIHRSARLGHHVAVLSLFAAALELSSPLPQAERFHSIMGFDDGTDPLLRRHEDRLAMGVLGARSIHLDFPDCIYRREPTGEPVVSGDGDLFVAEGRPPGEDELVEEAAAAMGGELDSLRPKRLLLPLALGRHRDHLLARFAGERARADGGRACELWYYEDAPYCLRLPDDRAARASAGAGYAPVLIELSEADLEGRITAIEAYVSQRRVVWEGPPSLAAAIRASAFGLGGPRPAERQWRPQA